MEIKIILLLTFGIIYFTTCDAQEDVSTEANPVDASSKITASLFNFPWNLLLGGWGAPPPPPYWGQPAPPPYYPPYAQPYYPPPAVNGQPPLNITIVQSSSNSTG